MAFWIKYWIRNSLTQLQKCSRGKKRKIIQHRTEKFIGTKWKWIWWSGIISKWKKHPEWKLEPDGGKSHIDAKYLPYFNFSEEKFTIIFSCHWFTNQELVFSRYKNQWISGFNYPSLFFLLQTATHPIRSCLVLHLWSYYIPIPFY